MRIYSVFVLLLAAAVPTAAQTTAPGQQAPVSSVAPTGQLGQRTGLLDFGFRIGDVTGDAARYQRFRDLRDGPTLDLLRYSRGTDTWQFDAAFDHVGYRDQRYLAQATWFGKVQVTAEWNQIPLFYSADTRTAFVQESTGVLRLPDSLQGGIQNGTSTVAAVGEAGVPFELRQRRDIADARLRYDLSPQTTLQFAVTSTAKTGEQPWGASFGFSAANEVALPLDQRTNDVNAGLEWSNERGLLRVAYDGSFFSNDASTLVFDNALRLTDTTNSRAYIFGNGTSQGRMSISPDSTAHTISGMGAIKLPGRSRAHAYVSLGTWSQNDPLLPFTINTALSPIALPRDTAEAEARIAAVNLGINSRPVRDLWLNARYRLYDFDNQTPHFAVSNFVRFDQTFTQSATGGSEPFGYRRQFFDVDTSVTKLRGVALRAGYGFEQDHRSFRFLDQTTEHTLRASVDSTGLSTVSVRGLYEYSKRTGEGFDEEAFGEIGEQVSLRQFDISDRNRHRLSTILQVAPLAEVGVTAQIGVGRDSRPDALLGLQDNNHQFFNVAVDLTPIESVMAGLTYGREHYDSLQRSRQANPGPQFNDPTRDWSTDASERVDTVSGTIALPQVMPKTNVSFGYDYTRAHARYVYLLGANSTLTPPEQLPLNRNVQHRSEAEVTYDLSERLAVGVTYWYDRYEVDDFAFDALTEPFAYVGDGIFLGYLYRDYTAHTGWVRLIVNW
jgi:MtrB/PioB family decaheme-associated outer membrane protein